MKREKGFTLIELLIVIVIIGILAVATGLAIYSSTRKRANDSRKKNIVAETADSLEAYKVDNDAYPADLATLVTGNYLKVAPEVINGDAYSYAVDANDCYTLSVDLDNDNDNGPNVVGTTDKRYEVSCRQ